MLEEQERKRKEETKRKVEKETRKDLEKRIQKHHYYSTETKFPSILIQSEGGGTAMVYVKDLSIEKLESEVERIERKEQKTELGESAQEAKEIVSENQQEEEYEETKKRILQKIKEEQERPYTPEERAKRSRATTIPLKVPTQIGPDYDSKGKTIQPSSLPDVRHRSAIACRGSCHIGQAR